MKTPLLAQWQRLIFPPEGTPIRVGEQLKTGNRYPDCSAPDWQAHQDGRRTYAVHPVYPGPDGDLCKFAVLDIDEGGDSLNKARALLALCDVAGLSAWQTTTRQAAERAKQVRTPGGRVRPLDKNIGTECLNTPVQGGAAECLLAALATLQLDSLNARLVNIVHDELVVECEPEQAGAVVQEVERAMVAGFLAIFPNGCTRDLVEAHSGPNWAAAKG